MTCIPIFVERSSFHEEFHRAQGNRTPVPYLPYECRGQVPTLGTQRLPSWLQFGCFPACLSVSMEHLERSCLRKPTDHRRYQGLAKMSNKH